MTSLMFARPALEKTFVLIVDDWNWREVRLGTFRAIKYARYSIVSAIEIRTTQDGSTAQATGETEVIGTMDISLQSLKLSDCISSHE